MSQMMFLTLNTGESIYRPSRPHEQSSEVVVVNVKAVGVFGVAEGNLGYARTLIPYLSSTLDVDTSRLGSGGFLCVTKQRWFIRINF